MGDILEDIFGTCGSKFAVHVDDDMSNLFKNQEHLMKLLKNNTSVLDSAINHIQGNENELKIHTDHLQ